MRSFIAAFLCAGGAAAVVSANSNAPSFHAPGAVRGRADASSELLDLREPGSSPSQIAWGNLTTVSAPA